MNHIFFNIEGKYNGDTRPKVIEGDQIILKTYSSGHWDILFSQCVQLKCLYIELK